MNNKNSLSLVTIAKETLVVGEAMGIVSSSRYCNPDRTGPWARSTNENGLECLVEGGDEKVTINLSDAASEINASDLALSLDAFSKKHIAPFVERILWETPWFEGVLPI